MEWELISIQKFRYSGNIHTLFFYSSIYQQFQNLNHHHCPQDSGSVELDFSPPQVLLPGLRHGEWEARVLTGLWGLRHPLSTLVLQVGISVKLQSSHWPGCTVTWHGFSFLRSHPLPLTLPESRPRTLLLNRDRGWALQCSRKLRFCSTSGQILCVCRKFYWLRSVQKMDLRHWKVGYLFHTLIIATTLLLRISAKNQ